MALLDDCAAVEDVDKVLVPNLQEVLRDDDCGLALAPAFERLED
jgi:hypothetical protein